MKSRLVDIANIAGVSKTTASRALSDSPLVREDTKIRVRQIAKELHYQPNALAQAMATKRSGVLGFCMYKHGGTPYVGHTFFGPVIDGAIEEAKQHGYHIMLAYARDETSTFDEHFIQDSIDGVLLISFAPRDAISEFRKRKIPLVLINDALSTPNNAFIVDDNYTGAYALMEHLIRDRGHRRIAIVTDRLSHTSYYLRYIAYLDALHAYDIPVYNNPHLQTSDIWGKYAPPEEDKLRMCNQSKRSIEGTPIIIRGTSPSAASIAMKRLLATGDIPTAVFAATDSIAFGVIKAIQEAGLRVPEDIAVAGYDDIEMAELFYPPLTTVRVNRHDIGRIAVRELLSQIAKPELESRIITVGNELIVRKST